MTPLIAHLLIALLSGTSNWPDAKYEQFYEQIHCVMEKEPVDLKDIEVIVNAFNETNHQIP